MRTYTDPRQRRVTYESPIGLLAITGVPEGIVSIVPAEKNQESSDGPYSCMQVCVCQLEEYFEGKRTSFDLPLQAQGSAYQQRIWKRLADVSYGKTSTYSALAKSEQTGPRAAGGAVGRNPVAIIVPCHRIVPSGTADRIGGYAWGRERKEWLLRHEAAVQRR
jgi:methylated-DNA-[protein]-cysteine S-methyltransferase